jgi:uncharacterized membrane protein
MGNWQLPVVCLIGSFIILLALRRRVKEVVADERDYKIAGKASYLAFMIYSFAAVISGMILFASKEENPSFELAGNVLLYSALFLIMLYVVLFKIYARKGEQD